MKMMLKTSSKGGRNFHTGRWIIFFLVLIGVICFQPPAYAGTWSQTTKEEFETNTQGAVDLSSQSGDVIVNLPNPGGHTVLMMNFDEGLGNPQDTSGNGNHGTNDGATWTTGKYGNALSFDMVDDTVTMDPSATLGNFFDNGGTVSAWIKANSAGENNAGWIFATTGNNIFFGFTGASCRSSAINGHNEV